MKKLGFTIEFGKNEEKEEKVTVVTFFPVCAFHAFFF